MFKADIDISGPMADFRKIQINTPIRMEKLNKDIGKEMVDYAVKNHPWENQTGNAERSINYKLEKDSVDLCMDVNYGIDLEMGFERRYAIIEPTVNKYAAEYQKRLAAIVLEES